MELREGKRMDKTTDSLQESQFFNENMPISVDNKRSHKFTVEWAQSWEKPLIGLHEPWGSEIVKLCILD